MTDTMMIRDCIRSQGMKLGHVAHVLGITNNTLRCKLENESEFKVSAVSYTHLTLPTKQGV